MLRSLALALALVSAPAVPQTPEKLPIVASTAWGIPPELYPEVVQVRCIPGAGSAFKTGPHTLLTVAHVSTLGGCMIDGKPINVIEQSGDFTILSSDDTADKWLTIDCGGFVKGHMYVAEGFARGLPSLTTVDVLATGDALNGFDRLWGVFTVIPGQSGGPIVDESTGKVVGTVNVYNAERGDSGSIALKDTPVCKSKSA